MDPRPLIRIERDEMTPDLQEELEALSFRVRRTRSGFDLIPPPVQRGVGRFFMPTRLGSPKIFLVSCERRCAGQTAVVCGSQGRAIRPRRKLPNDREKLKHRHAQALFETPYEAGQVIALGTKVRIVRFSLDRSNIGVLDLQREILYEGEINDLPENLEGFRAACEAAVRKAEDPKGDQLSFFHS